MGIEPPGNRLDMWALTDLVAFSRDTSGGCSIVDAISAARRTPARPVRRSPAICGSASTPPTTSLPERERAARRLGPHEFFTFIEGRAAMFAGLSDSTLSRDDGYHFLVLGRALERVDMTMRLLLSRVGDSASSPAWVSVLRAAGAHDTCLRTHRGVLDANRVVEFMLLDRLFPRSAFYSLRLASYNLDQLMKSKADRVGPGARSPPVARAGSQRTGVRPARGATGIARGATRCSAGDLQRSRGSSCAAILPAHTVGCLVGRRTCGRVQRRIE